MATYSPVGRVVALPNLPFVHGRRPVPDTYEYPYGRRPVRDHLGNLRLAYRPQTPQGQNLRLTNEPENADEEADAQLFSNFVPHRTDVRAHGGAHSLRATQASGRTGRTAQRVRLLAGQALAASAMAFYEGTGGGSAQRSALPANRTAERAGSAPTGEVVGSQPAQAGGRLEMQKQNATLAARIPDPSVPRARLVLKLYAEASGGTVIHTEETFIDNTASWSWQQLSVGKLATVDCWAEVYVENLAGVPVWFDDLEIATGALPVAIVVQETHYDPWGLELAGIGYNASGNPEHRWKFNGIEQNANFGLNWLEAKFRALDPALGRWNKVDPKPHHGTSLYAAMQNNPVRYADPLGDTVQIRFGGFLGIGRKTVVYNNGQLTNRDGSAYTGKRTSYLNKVTSALHNISRTTSGRELVGRLEDSRRNFAIQRGGGSNGFKEDNQRGSQAVSKGLAGEPIGSGGTINWSPGAKTGGPNTEGNTERPAFIGLAHEMGHAEAADRGMTNRDPFSFNSSFPNVRMDEYNAVHWENRIRSEQSLPLREFYTREGKTGFMPFVTAGGVGTGPNAGYNYNSNPFQVIYRGDNDGRD